MSYVTDVHQGFCAETSWYKHAHESSAREMAYLIYGLVGETGETADAFKKIIRETGFTDDEAYSQLIFQPDVLENMLLELGDIFWYFTRILHVLGVDLDDLLIMNTWKLHTRCLIRNKIPPNTPNPFEMESGQHPVIQSFIQKMRHERAEWDDAEDAEFTEVH